MSESSLRRHRNAHMTAGQEQSAAASEEPEIPLNAGGGAESTPRRDLAATLAAQDAELKRLAFGGATPERIRMVEAHMTMIMRKSESSDPRTALAAAKLILQAHELQAKLAGEMQPDPESAGGRTAIVVIHAGNADTALEEARGKTIDADGPIILLPDNGRQPVDVEPAE